MDIQKIFEMMVLCTNKATDPSIHPATNSKYVMLRWNYDRGFKCDIPVTLELLKDVTPEILRSVISHRLREFENQMSKYHWGL